MFPLQSGPPGTLPAVPAGIPLTCLSSPADLDMHLDMSRWAGRARQTVRYTTNDPRLPRFTLEVTASVEPS